MRRIGPFVIGLASSADNTSARLDRLATLGDGILAALQSKRFDPVRVNERIDEYRLLRERVLPLAELADHPGFALWLAECERRRDELRDSLATKVVAGDKSHEWDAIEITVIESLCLGLPARAADQAHENARKIQAELDAIHASNQKKERK